MSNVNAHRALMRQWIIFALLGVVFLFIIYTNAGHWWAVDSSPRWLIMALLAHAYFALVLFRNLKTNHRENEEQLLSSLGLANGLTLLRAILMSMVVGFLFSPRPDGAAVWLPGLLYTAAALPDYIDGIIARKTNHVTSLGEILDMNVDSIGVFTATFLAFQYGVIPWWYVPIGLARYIFVAGIKIREQQGKIVHELPFSYRRRGFAALKMGFMFIMLFPLFEPPGTYVAAAAFGVPFVFAFLWDWFQITGDITPIKRAALKAKIAGFLKFTPIAFRVLVVLLAAPYILDHIAVPGLRLLGYAELTVTLFIALGITPRISAIVAACLVGVNQNLAMLSLDQNILLIAYIEIILLGTGRLSLWPLEDWLIYHRIGDSA